MRAACVPLLPLPTQRGQLDTRVFSAKRKIELLVARSLRAGGSWRKSWNDARCCNGGERLAIGTMYPGGIPGPGLIFDACELVVVRRCRGVRCSTCATTCTPSPFVVSLSKWVSRSLDLPVARVVLRAVAGLHYGGQPWAEPPPISPAPPAVVGSSRSASSTRSSSASSSSPSSLLHSLVPRRCVCG